MGLLLSALALKLSLNPSLKSLTGLDNITMIGEGLSLYHGCFADLSPLANLVSVGGDLMVFDCDSLVDLNGLHNVVSVGGELNFSDCDALASLGELGNLVSIGGRLVIGRNDVLRSLVGLENIDPSTITKLLIIDCPRLATCEVKSVCDYLDLPSSDYIITGNGSGCDTWSEIVTACALVGIDDLDRMEVQLSPNPTLGVVELTGLNHGHFKVLNNQGQTVIEKDFSEPVIDMSDLSPGLYFVHIRSERGSLVEKILKR